MKNKWVCPTLTQLSMNVVTYSHVKFIRIQANEVARSLAREAPSEN